MISRRSMDIRTVSRTSLSPLILQGQVGVHLLQPASLVLQVLSRVISEPSNLPCWAFHGAYVLSYPLMAQDTNHQVVTLFY